MNERRRVERIGWRAGMLGTAQGRLYTLIAEQSTLPTRVFLAFVGACWTIALMIPGDSFERPTFAIMRALSGDHAEAKWTVAFGTYTVAAAWCGLAVCNNRLFSVVLNLVGFLLFFAVALAVGTGSGWPFPAGAAAHISVAAAAAWVFVRTGINSGDGWEHD